MCTHRLHVDSSFLGFDAFPPAPRPSVTRTSLPDKLDRSHSLITLRRKKEFVLGFFFPFLCMYHESVWVPCRGGCESGARRETLITLWISDCLFHKSWIFYFCPFLWEKKNCLLKMEGDSVCFSRSAECFPFVFVGAALTFLPNERQIEVKLMLARDQNKKDDEMGYTPCPPLWFFHHRSHCITAARRRKLRYTPCWHISAISALWWLTSVCGSNGAKQFTLQPIKWICTASFFNHRTHLFCSHNWKYLWSWISVINDHSNTTKWSIHIKKIRTFKCCCLVHINFTAPVIWCTNRNAW